MIPNFRIGQGFDVHQLVEGRPLFLCGVDIPYPMGLLGHSDADVAIHAICDALLGAANLNDIGYHFPDTNPAYKGINSRLLLKAVGELIRENNWAIGNIDLTIIAQAPKIAPFREQMRQNIGDDLKIDISQISIKGTTTEHLGFTGRKEGIAALSVALIFKSTNS